MSSTNFVDNTTVIYASWLNDVDAHVYDQVAGAHVAANITNTPAGNISSTTVQAAINELDTEKIATTAIGVSVQAYDANTTKNNASNTFTVGQAITSTLSVTGAITANGGITNSDAETLNISSATSQDITLSPGGTERIRVTSDGRLYGGALHNNAGAVTGTTNQYVASGTYTPTLTSVNNVAASTARLCQWMRVGNVVTVSGQCDVDPTAASNTQVGVSLPIASAFTTGFELAGMCSYYDGSTVANSGPVGCDATNDRAQLNFVPTTVVTNQVVRFVFTYEVK